MVMVVAAIMIRGYAGLHNFDVKSVTDETNQQLIYSAVYLSIVDRNNKK
jgi:hypothetical protein